MTNTEHQTLRFPAAVARRLDALLDDVRADPTYAGVTISKQFTMRRALILGIERMEQQYADARDLGRLECSDADLAALERGHLAEPDAA